MGVALVAMLMAACAASAPPQLETGVTRVDPHTLRGARNFITEFDLVNADEEAPRAADMLHHWFMGGPRQAQLLVGRADAPGV